MKILFVLEHYYPHTGGVEVLFRNLCEGLVKKGHKVEVVTTRLSATKKEEKLGGVKITRINTPPFLRRYFFTFLAIPYVRKIAKNYDIIHTTTYNGAFPARIASFSAKKPSVITVHEILGKDWAIWGGMSKFSAKVHQFLEWLIIRLNFDVYVGVSESTRNNVLKYKIPYKKTRRIYNGMDYRLFDYRKYDKEVKMIRHLLRLDGKFSYMFYGRPGGSKGFEYLLNAVPRICRKMPNSVLIAILGKRPEGRYKYFKRKIENHPYKQNIILIDPLEYREIPKYIKAVDCVVVPSLTEGFGYCVAESSAMGRIVVTTNTTSIPEVVSGRHILVEPKRSIALAKAIVNASKGRYKRTPMKKFLWSRNVAEYELVYQELLRKERR